MNETTMNPGIGPALAFYAKFSDECELLWGINPENEEEIRKEHFDDLEKNKFSELIERFERIKIRITEEVSLLLNKFKKEVASNEFVTADKKKVALVEARVKSKWECLFNIEIKDNPPTISNVQIGATIHDADGMIFVASWFSFAKASRENALLVINKDCQKIDDLPSQDGLWPDRFTLANQNILTAVEENYSVNYLVKMLVDPFCKISPGTWGKLLELGKKDTSPQ